MLPRTTHLTKLAINFELKSGYADGSCYDVEDALVYSLQHLQGLRVGHWCGVVVGRSQSCRACE